MDKMNRQRPSNSTKKQTSIGAILVFAVFVAVMIFLYSGDPIGKSDFAKICNRLLALQGGESGMKYSDEFQANGAFFGNTKAADGNLRKSIADNFRVGFFLIPNAYPDGAQPYKKNMLLYSFIETTDGYPIGDVEFYNALMQSWSMHPFVTGLRHSFGYESQHYHVTVNGKAMLATHFYQ